MFPQDPARAGAVAEVACQQPSMTDCLRDIDNGVACFGRAICYTNRTLGQDE